MFAKIKFICESILCVWYVCVYTHIYVESFFYRVSCDKIYISYRYMRCGPFIVPKYLISVSTRECICNVFYSHSRLRYQLRAKKYLQNYTNIWATRKTYNTVLCFVCVGIYNVSIHIWKKKLNKKWIHFEIFWHTSRACICKFNIIINQYNKLNT